MEEEEEEEEDMEKVATRAAEKATTTGAHRQRRTQLQQRKSARGVCNYCQKYGDYEAQCRKQQRDYLDDLSDGHLAEHRLSQFPAH